MKTGIDHERDILTNLNEHNVHKNLIGSIQKVCTDFFYNLFPHLDLKILKHNVIFNILRINKVSVSNSFCWDCLG